MPRVSVIIPSFNHEKYVAGTILSVLAQTFQDFEIIIVDDGSSDGSVEAIRGCSDPRIKLFAFEKNQGATVAVNKCIRESSGEYIAMLSSDDLFLPDKLRKQVGYLDDNPHIAAVFSKAQLIDEENNDFTDDSHCYYAIFEQENRSRHEWLNRFFYSGNCLCHPSMLIRSEHYKDFNTRFANIPDLDMWIRLCLKHEIHIMPEKLVRFRIRTDELNASGNKPETHIRAGFEFNLTLDNYLRISSSDELIKIFPDAAKFGDVTDELIPYFLARLAIETSMPFSQLWGLKTLYDLIEDKDRADLLKRKLDFGYPDFIRLTGSCDLFRFHAALALCEKDKQLGDTNRRLCETSKQLDDTNNQLLMSRQEIKVMRKNIGWKIFKEMERFKNRLINLRGH